jgi:hypothetical protein
MEPEDGHRRQRAEDHPIRGAILDALDGGAEMNTRELLREVPGPAPDDAMLGQVGYHCAVLDGAGLIERVDGTWRRRRG